ncbi:MAG: peptidoglycan DD-metalloendopeptidase family protein [Pseudomonadota bacterium]
MTILLPLLLAAFLQQTPQDETQRLRSIERRIEEGQRSAQEIRARTESLQETLDRLRGQLVSTAAALQDAEARATQLEQDLQSIEAREAVALEERDSRSAELSQVLGALQNLERSKPPALVVSPGDAQDAALAAIALSSLTPRLAEIVAARKEEILRLATLREDKKEAQRRLEETNSALSERRRLLEGLLAERQVVFDKDMAALQGVERETRRLAQEASSIRELIERLRALPSGDEVLRTYRRTRRDRSLPDTFTGARGFLDFPVAGIVQGRFGERDDTGERRDAIELMTRRGAVVTAPYTGTVRWAAEFGALGNVLIIDVGGGYTTVLLGLDSFVVRKNQRVGAGEPVGIMSPRQQAPRLQLQVRKEGRPVDPEPWFQKGA